MKKIPFALAVSLGLMLAGPPPILAGPPAEEETPEKLMREGMERMLRAIELMIEMVPQYEMPEVTEDGDIIIRRKRRPSEAPAVPESEETAT